MKILIIAPLSSLDNTLPVTGNTLPVLKMIDFLKKKHSFDLVNLSKDFNTGFRFSRFFQIVRIVLKVRNRVKENDLIYLTVAESFFGNLRDLLIYIMCYKKIDRVVIHMLGGAHMKQILQPSSGLIFKFNRFLVSRLGAVIVEGEDQANTFSNVIARDKIFINPNFAEDYLFVEPEDVEAKFDNLDLINVLFLSNHLEGKGHEELSTAFLLLKHEFKKCIKIDFVGSFPDRDSQLRFENKIKSEGNLRYHGPLKGLEKKAMFQKAHVFCMPTYYPFEGQPFTILEAYAAGCMVITTNHSGIGQVFKDGVNGCQVEKASVSSVNEALVRCVKEKTSLVDYGRHNNLEARVKYNEQGYLLRQQEVLNKVIEIIS